MFGLHYFVFHKADIRCTEVTSIVILSDTFVTRPAEICATPARVQLKAETVNIFLKQGYSVRDLT